MANEVKIILSADGSGVKVVTDGVAQEFVNLGTKAKDSSDKASSGVDMVAKSLDGLKGTLATVAGMMAGAFAVDRIYEHVKEMALLAARYETLGVSMTIVGKNAGYTSEQMEAAAQAMQHSGISMVESRQQAMRLVQAHIDLADSQKLARIAQDAAVIGNMNSSEAFAAMIHGISTGQPEVLRTIGLNVSMEQSYKVMAATLGKHVDQLTQNEKTQGILNAVFLAGQDIAGTYAAAMDTAGKQLNSMKRYTEDLKTVQGEVFNEALTVAVMGFTNHLKIANAEAKSLSQNDTLKQWGADVADVFAFAADAAISLVSVFQIVGKQWGYIAAKTALFMSSNPQSKKELDTYLAAKKAIDDSYDVDMAQLRGQTSTMRDALAQRRSAIKDHEDKLAQDTASKAAGFSTAIDAWRAAYQRGEMSAQQYAKAVAAMNQAVNGDNHVYRDTQATAPRGISEAAKALAFYNDLMDQSSGYSKTYAEDQNKLTLLLKTGKIGYEQYAVAAQKLIDQQPLMKEQLRAEEEAFKSAAKAKEDDFQALLKAIEVREKARKAVTDLRTAQQTEIAGMGTGDAARQKVAGIAQRQTQFADQPDLLAQSLKDYEDYLAQKSAAEASWELGAKDSMANYLSDIGNVYKSASALATKAFKGMEDALVNFVRTGKLDFASLADSIISDLVRIQIQQSVMPGMSSAMSSAGSWLASLFADGGAFTSGGVQAFGKGGSFTNQIVSSPTLFKFASGTGLMGEAGPEAIMPLTRASNGRLGVQASGGGSSMVVNIIESPGNGGQQSRRSENGVDILDVFVEKVKSAIAGDISRGSGAVPSAMAATYGLNRVAGAY